MIDRHVGKATAGGDVADRPEPFTDSQVVVRLEKTRRGIEAHCLEADVLQVGAASGRDQQLVTGNLAAVIEVDGHRFAA